MLILQAGSVEAVAGGVLAVGVAATLEVKAVVLATDKQAGAGARTT